MQHPHKRRRSIRLREYDYTSAGAYFVTICTHHHECIFGDVASNQMVLNALGEIVQSEWEKSAAIRDEIELDEFQVMPNHFHGIIWIEHKNQPHIIDVGASGARPKSNVYPSSDNITTSVGASSAHPQPDVSHKSNTGETANRASGRSPLRFEPKSLSSLMAGFKSSVTKQINQLRGTPGQPVWQRNFYERVIRNDRELFNIRQYIIDNPTKWALDENHPQNL